MFIIVAIPMAPQTARSFSSCTTVNKVQDHPEIYSDLEWDHRLFACSLPHYPDRNAYNADDKGGNNLALLPLRVYSSSDCQRHQYQGQKGDDENDADYIQMPEQLLEKPTRSKDLEGALECIKCAVFLCSLVDNIQWNKKS